MPNLTWKDLCFIRKPELKFSYHLFLVDSISTGQNARITEMFWNTKTLPISHEPHF